MSIFLSNVPLESAFVILDFFFTCGAKSLFQLCLTIFELHSQYFLQEKLNCFEINTKLTQFLANLCFKPMEAEDFNISLDEVSKGMSVQSLVEVANSRFGFLTTAKINQLRKNAKITVIRGLEAEATGTALNLFRPYNFLTENELKRVLRQFKIHHYKQYHFNAQQQYQAKKKSHLSHEKYQIDRKSFESLLQNFLTFNSKSALTKLTTKTYALLKKPHYSDNVLMLDFMVFISIVVRGDVFLRLQLFYLLNCDKKDESMKLTGIFFLVNLSSSLQQVRPGSRNFYSSKILYPIFTGQNNFTYKNLPASFAEKQTVNDNSHN